MEIPNLPTDSLYKFMSISGLVLVVLGLIMPRFLLDDLREEQNQLQLKIKLFNWEVEETRKIIEETEKKIIETDKIIKENSELREKKMI